MRVWPPRSRMAVGTLKIIRQIDSQEREQRKKVEENLFAVGDNLKGNQTLITSGGLAI